MPPDTLRHGELKAVADAKIAEHACDTTYVTSEYLPVSTIKPTIKTP